MAISIAMTDYPSDPDWSDDDRSHPLITPTDWDFLTTEGYFDDHARPSVSRSQQRQNIRARIRNGLLDLSLLFDQLDPDEITTILSTEQGGPDEWERQSEEAIANSLAFVLYGAGITSHMGESGKFHGRTRRLFKETVYRAGKKVGERDGSHGPYLVEDADYNIDATRIPRVNLIRDLEEGRELHPSAVRMLLEMEDVDTAPVQEELRKMLLDDTDGE